MQKFFIFILLLSLQIVVRGQTTTMFDKLGLPHPTTAKSMRYWIDDDPGSVTTVTNMNGSHSIDVSTLLTGLHTVYYQIIDSEGHVSVPYSSVFLKMSENASTKAHFLRYWFDDNTEVKTVDVMGGNYMLDVSKLLTGLHTVHYQIIDSEGHVSVPYSSVFLKMSENASTKAHFLRYWFDDNTEVKTVDVMGGNYMLDVSTLLTGLHTLHYQIIDDKGNVGGAVSGLFMKQYDKVVDGSENVITHYTYWMNDNSADNKRVKIENPSSPYQLITLLPMIKAPIRSYSFHFEVKDEMPTVYAKNDLHIRFEDATGYWVDAAHSFVDYSVSKTIKDFSELKTSQTFARPEENNIKWFKFEAASGDTIAFRASQATSLQVFAPSGKEILTTMGDKSVQYSGAHTWEDGTYYVAVHDVTGSKPNVTLDYMHMDKYDVVSQDVRVVGNGGCSTITFHGNGFKDLYDVVLTPVLYSEFYLWDHNSRYKGGYGDTIHAIAIDHISDSEVAVTFDFSKIELPKKDYESMEGGVGSYRLLNIYCSAKFNFTEGEKSMHKSLLVERPKDIELATKVSYPSTFLRGTTTTYTVEITNKGNMTAYQVPLMVGFRIPSIEPKFYIMFFLKKSFS